MTISSNRLGNRSLEEMSRLGHGPSRVDTVDVPGAFEIPLHAKLLAESGRYAVVVAAGLVVNGGTIGVPGDFDVTLFSYRKI